MKLTCVRQAAACVALLLVLAGCTNGTTSDPDASGPVVTTTPGALPRPNHVMMVIFENKLDRQVVGNRSAPYLSGLAATGAVFTNAHGIAHPSQPNYIALLSGSTHGVGSDACPQDLGDAPNLARQLIDAHLTFVGYAEATPHAGYSGCSADGGRYQRKHVPWADFSNIPARSSRPYADLPTNLSNLPTVSFVIPDMCHDMHNCSVATGDRWARKHLQPYVSWARTHNSLLIVTFDEDDGSRANHIPLFLVGPMVRKTHLSQLVDHDNVLRTLEGMYALAPLGLAARAKPLTGWARPAA